MHAPRPLIEEPTCIHCGLCLEACPTYTFSFDETDSPRGRIHLLAAMESGELPVDATSALPIDRCLGCLACESACPSGVIYRRILESGRSRLASARKQGDLRARLLGRVVLNRILPHWRRQRWLVRTGQLAQTLGLTALASRWFPVLPRMPRRLGAQPAEHTRSTDLDRRRGRAGLLLGCAGAAIFPGAGRAAASLLAAAGYDVFAPRSQGCCGALHAHAGDPARAAAFTRSCASDFADCDVVVATAAGCGAHLREACKLRPGDQEMAGLSKCTRDLSEVLLAAWQESPPDLDVTASSLAPRRVVWHDPCHLAHAQGVRAAPRRLLELAGCEILEAASPDRCCGGAGLYFLTQPEISRRLLDEKLEDLCRDSPEAIVTANPGCMLQLNAGGRPLPILHLAELLAMRTGC